MTPDKGTSHSNEVILAFSGDAAAVKECLDALVSTHVRAAGDLHIEEITAEGQTLTIRTEIPVPALLLNQDTPLTPVPLADPENLPDQGNLPAPENLPSLWNLPAPAPLLNPETPTNPENLPAPSTQQCPLTRPCLRCPANLEDS